MLYHLIYRIFLSQAVSLLFIDFKLVDWDQTRPRNNYRKLKQEFLKRYKPTTTTKKKKTRKGLLAKGRFEQISGRWILEHWLIMQREEYCSIKNCKENAGKKAFIQPTNP